MSVAISPSMMPIETSPAGVEGGGQNGRLSRSRRAHQIQHPDSVVLECFSVHRRTAVIFGEDGLEDLMRSPPVA